MFVAITFQPISYTNTHRDKFRFMPERLFFRNLLALGYPQLRVTSLWMDKMNIIASATAIAGSGTKELAAPISAVQSACHGSASTVNQHSAGRVMVRTVHILTRSISAAPDSKRASPPDSRRARTRARTRIERDWQKSGRGPCRRLLRRHSGIIPGQKYSKALFVMIEVADLAIQSSILARGQRDSSISLTVWQVERC